MRESPSLAGRAASAAGEGRGGGSARISAADVEKSFGATANESPMSVPPLTPERLPPPWGRVGWGQQTNQRSFLNTHAKHQETEIHEPTIGYRRNAIYPLPSPPPGPPPKSRANWGGTPPPRGAPPPGPHQNCCRFWRGNPPAAGFALRGREQFGANFDIHARTHPQNPAHLHTPERSWCM